METPFTKCLACVRLAKSYNKDPPCQTALMGEAWVNLDLVPWSSEKDKNLGKSHASMQDRNGLKILSLWTNPLRLIAALHGLIAVRAATYSWLQQGNYPYLYCDTWKYAIIAFLIETTPFVCFGYYSLFGFLTRQLIWTISRSIKHLKHTQRLALKGMIDHSWAIVCRVCTEKELLELTTGLLLNHAIYISCCRHGHTARDITHLYHDMSRHYACCTNQTKNNEHV